MANNIPRTAFGLQERLSEPDIQLPEVEGILAWAKEAMVGLADDHSEDEIIKGLLNLQRISTIKLMELSAPEQGVVQWLRNKWRALFSSSAPAISPDRARLIIETLPYNEVSPYVWEALLATGEKKHLGFLLSRQFLPDRVGEVAAEKILALPLEPKELIRLLETSWTQEEALKRLNQLPFDHDLYLESIRATLSSRHLCRESYPYLDAMVEKLLRSTDDLEELEILIRATSDYDSKVAIVGKLVLKSLSTEQLLHIYELPKDGLGKGDDENYKVLLPIFQRILEALPDDTILSEDSVYVNPERGLTLLAGQSEFRQACVLALTHDEREKAMHLLLNSSPSPDELALMLATETNSEVRTSLADRILDTAKDDTFLLQELAVDYVHEEWGRRACLRLIQNGQTYFVDVPRLMALYPDLSERLATLLPMSTKDAKIFIDQQVDD